MRRLRCCLGSATSGASHVLAAAQWRFNLAVTIGAFGHLHLVPVIEREAIVYQRCIALPAGRIDAHSAFFAFIRCHFYTLLAPIGCTLLFESISSLMNQASVAAVD
jgi:hypothetical protein